jgi:hypothetical protein
MLTCIHFVERHDTLDSATVHVEHTNAQIIFPLGLLLHPHAGRCQTREFLRWLPWLSKLGSHCLSF